MNKKLWGTIVEYAVGTLPFVLLIMSWMEQSNLVEVVAAKFALTLVGVVCFAEAMFLKELTHQIIFGRRPHERTNNASDPDR